MLHRGEADEGVLHGVEGGHLRVVAVGTHIGNVVVVEQQLAGGGAQHVAARIGIESGMGGLVALYGLGNGKGEVVLVDGLQQIVDGRELDGAHQVVAVAVGGGEDDVRQGHALLHLVEQLDGVTPL